MGLKPLFVVAFTALLASSPPGSQAQTTFNPGVKVSGMPGFPNITEAYAGTFARQKQLRPAVWVSSHAGHFDLHN